jgi:cysteine desulfurase
MQKVYLDYAAATPLDARVKKAMEPFWDKEFGNPHSIHIMGVTAKKAVEESRKNMARFLGAKEKEIVFTGGGTEANNLGVLGTAKALKEKFKLKKPHIITTSFEHPSILEPFEYLKKEGFNITYVPIQKNGVVNPAEVQKNLQKETVMVSIMCVNNEIGTIQPIREIGKVIKEFRGKHKKKYPYFHTDASQAPRFMSLNVTTLGVDLLTIDAAKIYGPKGVGALYIKNGTFIAPLAWGGGQEGLLRPGTENIPAIVGLGEAILLCGRLRGSDENKLSKLKTIFLNFLESIPCAHINGDQKKTVSGILNVGFKGLDGEELLIGLEGCGVLVTTSSACSVGGDDPSHVLLAIGRTKKEAKSAIRFSLGRETTKKDLEYVLKSIKKIVKCK